MGRWVYGDIDHKFWFATQPSSDIQDFGGRQPETSWSWDKTDLPECEEEIKRVNKECKEKTGISARNWLSKISAKGWVLSTNDPKAEKELWDKAMPYAAKFQLGIKIRRAIKEYEFAECTYEI